MYTVAERKGGRQSRDVALLKLPNSTEILLESFLYGACTQVLQLSAPNWPHVRSCGGEAAVNVALR
jgi:hypothetical protein